jgi:glycosyltransferase involved in cell wall biosynthesis
LKLKIGILQETYMPFIGGSSYRYHQVFKRLAKAGHEIDVYTARLSPDSRAEEEIDGLHIYRIETPKGLLKDGGGSRVISDALRFTIGSFLKVAKNRDYDIYEVNHSPLFPVFAAELLSKIKHVPVSITFHEVWKELWFNYVRNKLTCYAGIFLERLTTQMGSHVIAVSETTRERLINCYNVRPRKISVISNGVEFDLYRRASCPKIPYKIVYLGRLNEHKNVHLLIDAFREVKQVIPEATLHIAGDGPQKPRLEYLSRGIQDITFYGTVSEEEKARMLCSAWLYVLPSSREGQGITLLEAMASKTPTVAAFVDGSGVVSIIKNVKNGLLVRPEAEQVADAVLRYYRSPELYAQVQEEGLKFVEPLDWDNIALQHENLYRSMLAEKTGPL